MALCPIRWRPPVAGAMSHASLVRRASIRNRRRDLIARICRSARRSFRCARLPMPGGVPAWCADGRRLARRWCIGPATGRPMQPHFTYSGPTFSYFAATRANLEQHGKPVCPPACFGNYRSTIWYGTGTNRSKSCIRGSGCFCCSFCCSYIDSATRKQARTGGCLWIPRYPHLITHNFRRRCGMPECRWPNP
jgi:hypothetical protein